ncbi:unnamed protein product [Microthlaspi erraticum]|uniref:F-box domain-containing protein n=1 Tax=Microthlaspi erraticum TaxID=1685480 RepID=A0A6D2I887_9BRAS|nr:unnamed protein product [Microthlaspi erraticum]
MSSPEKKKRNKTTTKELLLPPTPESTPSLYLPDDLLLSCFARVSRLDYPTLPLASKGFGSLISSPELYQIRSQLNRTEICLYVCLSLPPDPNPKWFTLCRRPKLGSPLLVPVTSPPSTPVEANFVAVVSEIYQIGGRINGVPSSNVSVLDCRSDGLTRGARLQTCVWLRTTEQPLPLMERYMLKQTHLNATMDLNW